VTRMPMFRCEECGLVFYWEIVRPYVIRNYERMIREGTLDPEAYRGKDKKIPVSFYPKYYHPRCPACGGRSSWIFSRETGPETVIKISIFEEIGR